MLKFLRIAQIIMIIMLGFFSLFCIFIFSRSATNNIDQLFRIGMGVFGLLMTLYGILTLEKNEKK